MGVRRTSPTGKARAVRADPAAQSKQHVGSSGKSKYTSQVNSSKLSKQILSFGGEGFGRFTKLRYSWPHQATNVKEQVFAKKNLQQGAIAQAIKVHAFFCYLSCGSHRGVLDKFPKPQEVAKDGRKLFTKEVSCVLLGFFAQGGV